MLIALQAAFAFLACFQIIVGFLMLFAPTRYPGLYARFLNEYVVRRETSEHGHIAAIRSHGFVMVAIGIFFAFGAWNLR
ncbi:MAG TPA: hypothetical protein VGQ12_05490 [Candidatus Angelobacter sp.]|nr:hypothetical protein [Candidatus Angelobacter sp.]